MQRTHPQQLAGTLFCGYTANLISNVPIQRIFVVVAILLLFFRGLSVPYYYDDYSHFVERKPIVHAASWQDIFKNGLQETRPIYNLSLALQAKVFGTDSVMAHATNLTIHIGNALLWFEICRTLLLAPQLALLSTLAFALHPLTVESVVYFNSQSGLLSLFFSLLGILLVFSRRRVPFLLGLLSFVFGMASKEDGICGPIFALTIGFYRQIHLQTPSLHLRRALSTAATFATPILLYWIFKSPHIDTAGTQVMPIPEYLWRQGIYIPLHLSQFFFPWPLTLDRDFPPQLFQFFLVMVGWLILVGILFLAFKYRKNSHLTFLGLCLSLFALAPTHSFVPLLDLQANRILYPMIPGMALAATALIFRDTHQLRLKQVTFALVLVFLAAVTAAQIETWRNPIRLWSRDVALAPSRWRAWLNLGIELAEAKDWAKAEETFNHAYHLAPDQALVHYNLAALWYARTDGQQNLGTARFWAQKAYFMNPSNERAQKLFQKLVSAEKEK